MEESFGDERIDSSKMEDSDVVDGSSLNSEHPPRPHQGVPETQHSQYFPMDYGVIELPRKSTRRLDDSTNEVFKPMFLFQGELETLGQWRPNDPLSPGRCTGGSADTDRFDTQNSLNRNNLRVSDPDTPSLSEFRTDTDDSCDMDRSDLNKLFNRGNLRATDPLTPSPLELRRDTDDSCDTALSDSRKLLDRDRAELARERDEFAKEKEMLLREREDLERQREELARSRELLRGDAVSCGFSCHKCGGELRRRDSKLQQAIGCFGALSDCRIALGSLCNRFFLAEVSEPSRINTSERRLARITEENSGESLPASDNWGKVSERSLFKHSILRSISGGVKDKSIFKTPFMRMRSRSNMTFQTARSSSRDDSLQPCSPELSSLFSVRKSSRRGRSRSNNRDCSPCSSRGEPLSLGVSGHPERPLVVFKKCVVDALDTVSLKLNLDDPVIKAMALPAASPAVNETIRKQLIQNHTGLRERILENVTPLTFRNLILGFGEVTNQLRKTDVSKLVEIFENQWLIKVRPGANKLIDGRRVLEDYSPPTVYKYGRTPFHEGDRPFSLGYVIEQDRRNHKPAGEGVLWAQRIMELLEGLLSRVFEMVPPINDETLHQYMARLEIEVTDWKGYWRDCYSDSRCRREVLGFVVGKLVDVKMRGSAAMLFPSIMIDEVFGNSVKDVEDFLIDLRIAMRMLDLIL